MITAAQVVSVQRVTETIDCRRCGDRIERGQRGALVLGAGTIHLRCLLLARHGKTSTDSRTP